MTVRAVWNGTVLAESAATVFVEGNHYFPPDAVVRDYFATTTTQTSCPWKGTAYYLAATVGGRSQHDIAWFYPQPFPAAEQLRNHIAFSPAFVQVVMTP